MQPDLAVASLHQTGDSSKNPVPTSRRRFALMLGPLNENFNFLERLPG
jgi:hypothetical protein